MNKDYLQDVYNDFFREYDKALEEVKKEEIPKVMELDKVNISEESKVLLERIREYMNDNKVFIPFNLILNVDDKEACNSIIDYIQNIVDNSKYLNGSKKSIISFDDMDNLDSYKKISNDSNIIVLKDLNGLQLKDNSFIVKFFHIFEESLDNNHFYIIIGNKRDVDSFFILNNKLRDKYFPFVIDGIKPDILDVYQSVCDITNCSDEMKSELLDYITNTFNNSEDDYPTYRDKLCREILFNKKVPVLNKDKSVEEIFKELDELKKKKKVKKTLHELVDYMNFQKKSKDFNLKAINLHMVFLGSPGTGKTTVARMLANILYDLKYIKQNKLLEVSVKDLVAEYVGQTAPKVMSVVEKAMGGVLFIDEAYSLAATDSNSYNDEAIATLIKAMEDNRDNLVVIFAGYTKEMKKFLDSNSGITSRIGYTFEFEDYTVDELVEIFIGMVKKSGFIIRDDAIDKLRDIIIEYKDTENFGNARFVRNVYEKTIIKHASNTKDKKRKDILKTITKEDISVDNLIKEL